MQTLKPGPPARSELIYTLAYRGGARPRFDVSLSFRGGPSGRTRLRLPSRWAGQAGLHEALEFARTGPGRARVVDAHSPRHKVVEYAPNRPVVVGYSLRADAPVRLDDFGKCYRPVLTPDYFHFIGEAFFVHPAWDDERPRRITLRWEGLPPGWAVGNSFGTGRATQALTRSLAQLRHAVYVGGDFRVRKALVGGRPFYAAVRGRWPFSDRDFVRLARRVVKAERDFWDDHDFPYYFITLIPADLPPGHYGGTGLTDSLAAFASAGERADRRLAHLLAHELFHTWCGGKIRLARPEVSSYWFSEGFTEYYTRLLLLRAGLITLEEYVEDYNRAIFEYQTSPRRGATNAEIVKGFWRDEALRRLPYLRGDLLAHNWNVSLRAASGGRRSLDDLMADLLRAARDRGQRFSADAFNRLAARHLPGGLRRDVRKYVEAGVPVAPDANALGPCTTLRMTASRRFDLGFDREAFETRRHIEGVRRDGPAFRAGLRDGQQVLAARIFYGDPTREVEITVLDSAGQRLLRFYPAGEELVIPQYALDRRALEKSPAACRAWFGL